MSKTWSKVPLAEIAKPISRPVEVIPGQSYRTIGVKWWGEGAYERETIDGSRTAAKTLSVVRQGDLIINKIWVRHGSTAIAGSDVDGCAASGEFPTFDINKLCVVPAWLHWQTKTPGFWAKCDALSRGTSGKNRIKPELFLTIRVPLPSLAEQQQVVARIEVLAAQIHEARALREQAAEQAATLSHSYLSNLLRTAEAHASWPLMPLGSVAEINPGRGNKEVAANANVSFVPMRAVSDETGRIVAAETRNYDEVSKGYTRFEDGDVIFARITPCMQNGKSAIANGLINGVGFGSTEFHVVRPNKGVEAKWLHHLFRHREFLNSAAEHFTGTAGQQRVPPSFMREKMILVPPLPEQRLIVAELDALQAEVDAMKRMQAETAAELDALLPSILDKAFRGELVPQDPTDESAEILLRRIRSEFKKQGYDNENNKRKK